MENLAYKMIMAAWILKFSNFEILSKTERYYKKWIGNTVLCDRNAKHWEKITNKDYFFIFRKKSSKVFKIQLS